MTEEDLSALVTSIDENDIEIIPSNGSDINEQLDFVNDYFVINDRNVMPPPPPIVPIQTPRLIREDPEVIFLLKIFILLLVFKRNLKMKHSSNDFMV